LALKWVGFDKRMLKLVLLWTLCLFLMPVLVIQGLWTRKRGLKLPEAAHPDRGSYGNRIPVVSILGIGDSVIAGVGVDSLEDALTAQIAKSTSERTGHQVNWCVQGSNGDRVGDLLAKYERTVLSVGSGPLFSESGELLESEAALDIRPDYVIVSIGVNDVSHLTSLTRWHYEVTQLIAELREQFGVPILFLGIPPMGKFPALPQPLKFALGIRAAMLDQTIQRAAELLSDIYWLDTDEFFNQSHMALDGYHPSVSGCQMLGEKIAGKILELESTRVAKGDGE
jgi:lysophospholipase L1-like esterase